MTGFHPIRIVIIGLSVLFSAGAAAKPSDDDILRRVQSASDSVIERITERRTELDTHPERIHGAVSDLIVDYFDFEAMTRSVMGKYWPRATGPQRHAVVVEFTELLVRTYGVTVLKYSGEPIRYGKVSWSKDDQRVRVETTAEPQVGQPVQILYYLHEAGGDWRVYDVVVEDLSLVTNYRASFSSEIRSGGVDGLIGKLQARNRELGG